MSNNINLGKNGKFGNIDFDKLSSGITKEELCGSDKELQSIFDKLDTTQDGTLDRNELQKFIEKIEELAGDSNLAKKEAKKFDKDIKKDVLYKFLNQLSTFAKEKGIEKVNIKSETQSEIITYEDGHTEEVFPDGSKILTIGNKKTFLDKDGNKTKEIVTEGGDEIVSEYENNEKVKETITNETSTTVKDFQLNRKTTTDTLSGWETISDIDDNIISRKNTKTGETVSYKNGQETTTTQNENIKNVQIKKDGKILRNTSTETLDDGSQKVTDTVYDGENNTTTVTQNGYKLEQTKVINGKTYNVKYDGKGNTIGIIVQNGESINSIAKKFGCTPLDLIKANAGKVKGSYPNSYFIVGEEIKIPSELEADSPALQGRTDKSSAIKAYEIDENKRIEARKAREAAEKAARAREEQQAQEQKAANENAQIQKQSAKQIVDELMDAIKWRNDLDKIQQVIARIDDPEELAEVNRLLEEKGYKADDKYSAIEKFIYKENNHSYIHKYNSSEYLEQTVQKWIDNGTLKGKEAVDAQARMACRIIFDGGDGFGTNCDKIKKGIYMIKCPKPTGDTQKDRELAKQVYDKVNEIISKHNTFYGLGSKAKNLIDYCEGEMWDSEIKYLKGILAENNAIQGEEKAQAVADLTREAVEGGGTDIQYLKQAIKAINSPEDRKAVEAKLKEYCEKKGIKPQIEGQDYLQAILYDECDTFLGISKDHKEIRKFNEMLIKQGAYNESEIIKLRAEQAALEILEGNFANIQDAVKQIKDKDVLAKLNQLISTKGYTDLNDFLSQKLNPTKMDLINAELASNNLLDNETAAEVAFRLIQNSDFDNRAMGLKSIRNQEVAKIVDEKLKESNSSLAEVLDKFNKEKESYKTKAAIWDGLAYILGDAAEYISDQYSENTDVSDSLYVESNNTQNLTVEQKEAYKIAVHTFEEGLNLLIENYEEALDSQGVVSGWLNILCERYNIGTTRDDIEARIEHDKETLRLLKLASEGKLSKFVDGKEVAVTFEEVWKERQSDFITANGASISAIKNIAAGKEITEFDSAKVQKVADKAQTIVAMNYAKDAITVSWEELSNAKDEKQLSVSIVNTLNKLSNMSGRKLSLEGFGYHLENGIIVDSQGNTVSIEKLQQLAAQLKQGLSDISKELFGIEIPLNSNPQNTGKLLNSAYDSKMETFKQEYREAFGQEVPDEMIDSYLTTINSAMMVTNIGVMIAAVVAAPFTGGGSLAVFGITAGASVGLNALEHSTDADGWTNEEWTADTVQGMWDGALAACGVKIGQIAETFAKGGQAAINSNKLLAKLPQKNIGKILNKAKEIATQLETKAGNIGQNVFQAQKAKLLTKFPQLNPNTAEKVSVILSRVEAAGFEISSDSLQSLIQTYCMNGEFDSEQFLRDLIISVAANSVGHAFSAAGDAKESGRQKHIEGRNAIADAEVARNINQKHLNANESRMIEDGVRDIPTENELANYMQENGYKAMTPEEQIAYNKHQQKVQQDYSEAHRIENNINNEGLNNIQRNFVEPDINQNGIFKNENAVFSIENGKVIEIKTKDGRVITDDVKIAKYLNKNSIELNDLVPDTPSVKTFENMNENELFAEYQRLRSEMLDSKGKVNNTKKLREIEKTLDKKGYHIEHNSIIQNKKVIKQDLQAKLGKKLYKTYKAIERSIGKIKNIADFNKLKAHIETKFAQFKDVVNDLLQKLKSKAASLKLEIEEINPNKHLNKYKRNRKVYGEESHYDFVRNNPKLFKNSHDFGFWQGISSSDPHHGAWKMHLFSIDEKDWQELADVIIPYLREHDIDWKTFNSAHTPEMLTGDQAGKAFTIYPRNKAHFEQIARDIDYIIQNNKLEKSGSSIIGDRELGYSGRLFYRYEFNSKAYADEVLDLSSGSQDWNKYDSYYESNRGADAPNGGYIARDMGPMDDPFRYFNPSNPNSRPAQRLTKNQPFSLDEARKIHMPGYSIDLNSPEIKNILDNLPEGGSLTIGREGDIKIPDEYSSISRIHAVIHKENGKLVIIDYSTNGTSIE